MPRAYWKGSLKLSLVTCPIALYPAITASEKTRFHMINTETGNRLVQQMVDSETGDVVDKDQKGRGYEIKKGRYVPIEKEDLDTGPCVDFNTSGSGPNVIVNACNAGGSDWIVFDTGNGRQLISVWATNHLGGSRALFLDNAATTGDQLVIADSELVSPTNWGH